MIRNERRRRFEIGLTQRQYDVLWLVCNGLTNKEIAEVLSTVLKTVEHHTHVLYEKLEPKTRAHLVKIALEQGYVGVIADGRVFRCFVPLQRLSEEVQVGLERRRNETADE